jgi:hypothetical protein
MASLKPKADRTQKLRAARSLLERGDSTWHEEQLDGAWARIHGR